MDNLNSLLRSKTPLQTDTSAESIQPSTSSNLAGISGLNSLGYLGAAPGSSAVGHCAKCQEIYGMLNAHILECHKIDLCGNEKDSNSILNNVLMNILMLLTTSTKPNNEGGHSHQVSASLENPSRSTISRSASTSGEAKILQDGFVSADSLQKLLSSAQNNHSKTFAHKPVANERRKTVVKGIPLINPSAHSTGNPSLVLPNPLHQERSYQTAVAPKVSEKPDLDVADILVNKMPIPSVNKEETSLAQLYLKQLTESLAATGKSDIGKQPDLVSQSISTERDLVNALLSQGNYVAPPTTATMPTADNSSKPMVETISQILAAQKQLTGLLTLLGKRQNEPTLLPVAGLASQLVETPLNNPLFANPQQKIVSTPGMLQIPLSSILPALTSSGQGLIPNLMPNNQSAADNVLQPHIANILSKTNQGFQTMSGTGAVALPALALNSSVIPNTPMPVLHHTIQGLRGSVPQTVLLPSILPSSITNVTSSFTSSMLGTQAGIQSFLFPNRQQGVSQQTTTTKTLFTTIPPQGTVPSLAEQLFQNSNNIPKLALSTVPSVFNLGNLPGMSILNPVLQGQIQGQGQARAIRQVPLLPNNSVIVPSSNQTVTSVDKIQGLITAALQNPGKSNSMLSSTSSRSATVSSGSMFGKRSSASSFSMQTQVKEGESGDAGEQLERQIEQPKNLYKCATCGTTFSVLSTLQHHEQTHLGTKVQCNYCNDVFTDYARYQDHISLHRGEENVHHCEYCSKLFTSRGELQKHLAEHTQKRPYKCKHCAKAFRDPGSLQKHERIHTGERPYRCTSCSRAFAEYSSLRKHNRVHTGEKPYKCPRCPKAFSISGNLQRHMFIHTGERPYRCTKCPKAFNNPSHLRRHVKNLHEGRKGSGSMDVDAKFESDTEIQNEDFISMTKE